MVNRIRAKSYKRVLSISMLMIFAISLLILPIKPALGNSEVTIFSEDFEGVFPTDNGWTIGDLTTDNDDDYWGATNYKAHSGSKSGWCAQIGDSTDWVTVFLEDFEGDFGDGINGWSVGDENAMGTLAYWDDVSSTFGNEGAYSGDKKAYCAGFGYDGTASSPVHQNYMDAYMSREVNLTDFDAAVLLFVYKMPSLDVGWDFGQVLVDGVVLYTYDSVATDWTAGFADLTPYVGSVVEIKWNFHSDEIYTYEGWYADYIWVLGLLSTPTPNAKYHNYDNYMDAYMQKQINLTGFFSATLSYDYWFNSMDTSDYLCVQTSTDGSTWNDEQTYTGNSAGWVQDTVDLTPFVGSSVYIRFLFYSDDISKTFEGAYLDDIVITVVDVTDPTVSITSPTTGTELKSSSVAVSWSGSDVGAGIDYYEVRLDGGSWINKGMATTHTFSGVSDGSHTIEVKALDKGGNSDDDSVSLTVNTSLLFGPGWMEEIIIFAVIIIAIAAAAIGIFLVKGRKPPLPPPPPGYR